MHSYLNLLLTSLVLSCVLGIGTVDAQIEIIGYSIDGGAGVSAGGDFTVEGTIGQPDAGTTSSGGNFSVTGGVDSGDSIILGDVNGDGQVNLLDVAPFVDAVANGTFIPAADVNQDGSVNLLDVAPFIDLLSG